MGVRERREREEAEVMRIQRGFSIILFFKLFIFYRSIVA